jgi:hypothetical protein
MPRTKSGRQSKQVEPRKPIGVFWATAVLVFFPIVMVLSFYASAFFGELTGWYRIEKYISHSDH